MTISMVGLDHSTAPTEVREKLAFTKDQLPEALMRLEARVGPGVILSTCNRTEVYGSAEKKELRRFLADISGLAEDELSGFLFGLTDVEAVGHLFRVASGLESMVLGEPEILGQVKESFVAATRYLPLPPQMTGLFQAAISAGGRVRAETGISKNSVSISYAGVRLAKQVLGDLNGRSAMVVGIGEIGRSVAQALKASGVGRLVLANRTLSRADELAQKLGAQAIPLSEVPSALSSVDVVTTATDSPEYIITRDMAVNSSAMRRTGRQLYLDLAVPRNIDPSVDLMDAVELYNVDDLRDIAEESRASRKRSAAAAEQIISTEVVRFMQRVGAMFAIPVIKRLHEDAESLRLLEVERALNGNSVFTESQQEIVRNLTRSIIKKVLHHPTMSLRSDASEANIRSICDMFQLSGFVQ